ncbi:guanylate kinase [Naumannella halotolerans]|uniref:Guanylate kinase n=1 Tax=Naumannella halotolerans TaxID=993414 RepID=A0A4R7J7N5_9ACTN|nr:guanylate kinase [Naumannella halotolerans]TDT33461.1 guanylate kinase [Naumannella halotolerans]
MSGQATDRRERPGQGELFILSGPAGVGKGTVVAALQAKYPSLWVSVSATTRAPRPGEVDGKHYLFTDDAEFDDLIAHDGLLEWATVHRKARYGTPRAPVQAAMAEGHNVLLEIDPQGARQVRRTMPQAHSIFLMPPSWEELVRRLTARGTEDQEAVQRRLQTARSELAHFDDFDHVVVNVDIDTTVEELAEILGLRGGVG